MNPQVQARRITTDETKSRVTLMASSEQRPQSTDEWTTRQNRAAHKTLTDNAPKRKTDEWPCEVRNRAINVRPPDE